MRVWARPILILKQELAMSIAIDSSSLVDGSSILIVLVGVMWLTPIAWVLCHPGGYYHAVGDWL